MGGTGKSYTRGDHEDFPIGKTYVPPFPPAPQMRDFDESDWAGWAGADYFTHIEGPKTGLKESPMICEAGDYVVILSGIQHRRYYRDKWTVKASITVNLSSDEGFPKYAEIALYDSWDDALLFANALCKGIHTNDHFTMQVILNGLKKGN